MAYSVNLLSTAPDCDAVLAWVAKERPTLQQRQASLTLQLTQFDTTSPEVVNGLTAVTAQQAAIASYINDLPMGSAERRKVELEKERLDVRQRLLAERHAHWGPAARLEREADLARVIAELAELATLEAAVLAHRATL